MSAGKRVLIVEHNEVSQDVLARRLASKGFEVLLASDGQDGLSMANEALPDLILMELAMPMLDGWVCARRLKASPTTKQIPIIAMANPAKAADRNRALKSGFDEFETKPVDFEALLAKVDRLLEVAA